jgi:hypothetical protein
MTSSNIGCNDDDDDDDEDNANKWTAVKIDIFKDFKEIDLLKMKSWASGIWHSDDAILSAKDGKSEEYARKALSEFLFGSMVSQLQKSVQNSIMISCLWNDGPCVWATLVHHFFPSPPATLKTTLIHKIKAAMLLSEHNNDLKVYCAKLLEGKQAMFIMHARTFVTPCDVRCL